MEKINLKHELYMHYTRETDTDFYIQEVGYHDFHFISPLKVTRIQGHFTIHFILSGSGTLFLNNNKYDIEKGNVFYVPPNTNLCYYPNEDDPWRYFWFSLNGSRADFYAKECNLSLDNPVTICHDSSSFYQEVLLLMTKLQNMGRIGYYETLSLFYKLLDIQTTKHVVSIIEPEIFAITYMDLHFHEMNLSMEQMCHELHISHSYLCRRFHKRWNTHPRRYLIGVRVSEAKKLLETTGLTIKEIGYSVGFQDEIHFMKTFKKVVGMTCKKYRLQIGEGRDDNSR